jgi:hypothetical protein
MGRVVQGGELSMGDIIKGLSHPWGGLSMRYIVMEQGVMKRDVMRRVVRGTVVQENLGRKLAEFHLDSIKLNRRITRPMKIRQFIHK